MPPRNNQYGYAGASHVSQDRVLTSEEDYGGIFDEDDDFGALMSTDLASEELYGDDVDDDAEFGADDDGDSDDADALLDQLDSDLDSEVYGAWYGVQGALAA